MVASNEIFGVFRNDKPKKLFNIFFLSLEKLILLSMWNKKKLHELKNNNLLPVTFHVWSKFLDCNKRKTIEQTFSFVLWLLINTRVD